MGAEPAWASLAAGEVRERAAASAIAVLPLGATEQHGPHLATGADSFFAEQVALAAARETGDVVLPTVTYGCSLGHTDRWPGTISLGPQTMISLLLDIGRWVYASGFRRLVMLNAHATNGPPAESALLELRHELPDLRMRFQSVFDLTPEIEHAYVRDAADFHANAAETSLMLHLDPARVEMGRAVDEPDRTVGRVLRYPLPAVSESGVVGTPSLARAESGAELFAQLVEALKTQLESARAESDPLNPHQEDR